MSDDGDRGPRAARSVGFGTSTALTIAGFAALWAGGLAAPAGVEASDVRESSAKGSPTLAIPRHTVASGGGTSSGGTYEIAGTIGQADADPLHPATGGVFAISGGFWPGLATGDPAGDQVFADGFETPQS